MQEEDIKRQLYVLLKERPHNYRMLSQILSGVGDNYSGDATETELMRNGRREDVLAYFQKVEALSLKAFAALFFRVDLPLLEVYLQNREKLFV